MNAGRVGKGKSPNSFSRFSLGAGAGVNDSGRGRRCVRARVRCGLSEDRACYEKL